MLARDEAIERGWFGRSCRRSARDSVTSWSRPAGRPALISMADFPYENMLVGFHGSLTAVEMEIPILVC